MPVKYSRRKSIRVCSLLLLLFNGRNSRDIKYSLARTVLLQSTVHTHSFGAETSVGDRTDRDTETGTMYPLHGFYTLEEVISRLNVNRHVELCGISF